jgi:hypothetical protein
MNLYKLSFVGDDPYGYRYTCVVCAQDAEEAKKFSDSLYWDDLEKMRCCKIGTAEETLDEGMVAESFFRPDI